MKILRPLSIAVCSSLMAASAFAQVKLLPPPGAPPPVVSKPAKAKILKPAAKRPAPAPTPAPAVTAAPVPDDPNADVVYGAYQRGQYKTAFDLANARAQNGDPK